jgi:hypothetical protein
VVGAVVHPRAEVSHPRLYVFRSKGVERRVSMITGGNRST